MEELTNELRIVESDLKLRPIARLNLFPKYIGIVEAVPPSLGTWHGLGEAALGSMGISVEQVPKIARKGVATSIHSVGSLRVRGPALCLVIQDACRPHVLGSQMILESPYL